MINLSTGAFYERATRQIGRLRERANDLQQQIGSGERLSRSSDDPVAAARAANLARRQDGWPRSTSATRTGDGRPAADRPRAQPLVRPVRAAKELAMQADRGRSAASSASCSRPRSTACAKACCWANGRNGLGPGAVRRPGAGLAYQDTRRGFALRRHGDRGDTSASRRRRAVTRA
jgi:flagellar hook-associated protein 3 FlgL